MGLVGGIPLWLSNRPKPTINWSMLGALPSNLTFSRAGDATVTDSTGKIAWAPANKIHSPNTFNVNANVVVTAAAYTEPNGKPLAVKLTDNSTNATHSASVFDLTCVSGFYNTFSIHLRAGTETAVKLVLDPAYFTNGYVHIDLQNKVAGTIGAGVSDVVIQSLSDDWIRVSFKSMCVLSGAASFFIAFLNGDLDALSTPTYSGTGSYFYVYGCQLELTSHNSPQAYNSTGNYYGPRFDFDPVTLAPRGLLMEEQRQNLCYPHVPYIDATYWGIAGVGSLSGLNQGIAPDGTNTMASLREGTGTSNHGVYHIPSRSFTAGDIYTLSVFAKKDTAKILQLTASPSIFGTEGYANFDLDAGTVTKTGSLSLAAIRHVGGGIYRCSIKLTAQVTATGVAASFALTNDDPVAARFPSYTGTDKRLLLWGAQCEKALFASSLIPTTTAPVTRAADACMALGLSSLRSEGTLYVEGELDGFNQLSSFLVALHDASNNKWVGIYNLGGTDKIYATTYDGSFSNAIGPSITPFQKIKAAVSYSSTSSMVLAVNGVIYTTTDPAKNVTGLVRMDLGNRPDQLRPMVGHDKIVKYWNRALDNATLQRITT